MHRSRHRYLFDEERSQRGMGEVWASPPLTLDEARAADAFVVLWGEYGGSTYLIAAARALRCTQAGLDDLLALLDENGWNDFAHAGTCFVARQEAVAAVKPHHVRLGDHEAWIARPLVHLAEASLVGFEGSAHGG